MHLLPRHMMESISRWLAQEGPPPRSPFWEFSRLSYELRPGDVVLLEGRSRICAVIKWITQSSWTHSVLYIGHLFDIDDRHLQARIRGSYEGDPGEQLVVEALLGQGGVISPLIKYRMHHLRICRPAGLDPRVARRVGEYTPHHLYCDYDMRQMFDLARFFFPWSILPRRWRSSLFEYHAGTPTRTPALHESCPTRPDLEGALGRRRQEVAETSGKLLDRPILQDTAGEVAQ